MSNIVDKSSHLRKISAAELLIKWKEILEVEYIWKKYPNNL